MKSKAEILAENPDLNNMVWSSNENDEGAKDLESQIDLYRDNKMAILGMLEELDVEFVTVCYSARNDQKDEPFITVGDPSDMASKAAFSDDITVVYQTEDGMAENSLTGCLIFLLKQSCQTLAMVTMPLRPAAMVS